MYIKNNTSYWYEVNRNTKNYPTINSNEKCDVLIVGGGIAGCLTCYYLSLYNIDTILVEKNIIGSSNLFSNACLLTETDEYISKMIHTLGEEKAVRSTKLCQKSLDEIEKITYSLNRNCDFHKTKTIHLCENKSIEKILLEEYNLNRNYTIPVNSINSKMSTIPAIYSSQSAVIDPIKFSHALIKSSYSRGSRIYENSPIENYYVKNKINNVTFSKGTIQCQKVVYTISTNSQNIFNKFALMNCKSTSIISNIFDSIKFLAESIYILEANEGKLLIRTTEDNRLFASFYSQDTSNENILNILLNNVKNIFPEYNNLRMEYKWENNNFFTSSKLPVIGKGTDFEGFYYNIPYGINEIIYSLIGASIIKDLILYNNNPDVHIFDGLI